MKTCIYCGLEKPCNDFSDEHIWPDALGGDFLPTFWRTDDVCGRCNSASGVFVDGAFIKSFFVSIERSFDALDYLDPDKPTGILPLSYLGTIQGITTQEGEVADFWVCAPGANIVHFRTASEEDAWNAYAGGDPRRQSKRSKAGRVAVTLTSAEPYWIRTALSSVKHHFAKADKFVTNLQLPPSAKHFKVLDPNDLQQAADLCFLKDIKATTLRGDYLRNQVAIASNADGRFLAKLALAVGYKLFGAQFLQTSYGLNLRKAFREANHERRLKVPIRGSGYLQSAALGAFEEKLRWPGGWVLLLMQHQNALSLTVQTPSGRSMVIQVTDDSALLGDLGPEYRDGIAWVTVPAAARAVGPIHLPEYLAHQIGQQVSPKLRELDVLRGLRNRLPPTGISDPKDPEAGMSKS
ncbi:HNH endonuclease [Gluconobacter japonicus]|uniref:HNH endonuclease n=1 Tax=Gluconobacter japonicus TaxID=376620 RepID=A0A9Q2FP22_GLUJA|nr:HNH endonuclease [Gluconobacter japonicus]MBF0871911.1 HNH endonuclease [Gluconobacter japonicus]